MISKFGVLLLGYIATAAIALPSHAETNDWASALKLMDNRGQKGVEVSRMNDSRSSRLQDSAFLIENMLRDPAISDEQRDQMQAVLGLNYLLQRKYEEAIPLLEAQVLRNPKLEVDLTDQAGIFTSPIGELGFCYEDIGDLNRALEMFERHLEYYPDSPRIRGHVANIRRKLCDAAKPSIQPLIVPGKTYVRVGAASSGTTMVSLNGIKKILGLAVEIDRRSSSVKIVSNASPSTSVYLKIGSVECKTAEGKLILPVAPTLHGNDIMVPLRSIVEHFGRTIKWDPQTKIAWVE